LVITGFAENYVLQPTTKIHLFQRKTTLKKSLSTFFDGGIFRLSASMHPKVFAECRTESKGDTRGHYDNFLTPVSMHMTLDAQNLCVPNRMVTGMSGHGTSKDADVTVSADAK
jgi:hypothetical protein